MSPRKKTIVVKEQDFLSYPWSSLPAFLGGKSPHVDTTTVLGQFSSTKGYKKFVLDQADYAKKLEEIKHLTVEK